MEKIKCIAFIFLGYVTLWTTNAQEGEINVEDSAEVFLEEFSDDFQETFFEALKQKGIENHDRAINLLLECKNIDSSNKVVDHELAKAYYETKKFMLAHEYGMNALQSEPDNLWYLNTLVRVYQRQGKKPSTILEQFPNATSKQKENLAQILYKQNKFRAALNILIGINNSFSATNLVAEIEDSIDKRNKLRSKLRKNSKKPIVKEIVSNNPFNQLKNNIDTLIKNSKYSELVKISSDAIETFPSQPYFYYANGLVFVKTSKYNEAIEILEMGLDLLIDNVPLANRFYKELANAHVQLGNSEKANMYLSKIK